MNTFFLKSTCVMAIAISLHAASTAQPAPPPPAAPVQTILAEPGELIIKSNGDKNIKILIEIKDGHYLIDGKPMEEYHNDAVDILHGPAAFYEKEMALDKAQSEIDRAGVEMMAATSPFRVGHKIINVRSDAAFLGVACDANQKDGANIREVTNGSAAEKAGLQKGDIITRIDEHIIENPEMLTKVVRGYKPENKVRISFTRNGKQQTAMATLGKMKDHMEMEFNSHDLGPDMPIIAEGRYAAPWFRDYGSPKIGIKAQDTEDGKGVKVLAVDDDSNAAKAGVKEGDIITNFDGTAVTSAFQLMDLAKDAKTKASVKITLLRDGKTKDTDLKIPHILRTADL